MELVQEQETLVFFRTSQCVRNLNPPMVITKYGELKRKGLVSDSNRMRVVEQIGNMKHITLAVWPKEEIPKHQLGPGNCYDTYLTSTQAKVSYAGLRGESVPSEGDEGFLYLIAWNDDKRVYRWGFFRVARVRIDIPARDYLKYTIEIEKIDYVARPPTPKPPKPATPKRKCPAREEGTSSAGKKKKQCDDKMTQLKLQF